MPGAVLMTLGLSFLLNRFSMRRVFFLTLSIFVSFFLLFTFCLYPLLSEMSSPIPELSAMLFFVMAELWKIALLTVLFWGFVNQFISFEVAKLYYAPLMLGGSVGAIAASPLISLCNTLSHHSWSHCLVWMAGLITFVSLITAWMFSSLFRFFSENQKQASTEEKPSLSVWESLQICFRSKYLMLLAWLTIADYIAYSLGEVIFLDVLKQKFPASCDYCDFQGKLALWNGILTAVSALVITPYLLRRCRWIIAAMVTPICIFVTEGAFFFALWHPTLSLNIELLVFLGALFFCLVRAAKYTLFDTSKELSFVLLSPLEKMQGKLVVDGMCARLGRGSGSLFSLLLIQACGSVLATVPIAGVISVCIAASCVFATSRLGSLVEEKTS